ncbi:MAG: 2Fe-2S iron-sulfur cluster-binding protein [Pseudomonadota bacterium]
MSQTFEIDGQAIPFEPGQTIIDASLTAGLYIPHLCHHPEFTPHGSCRLCIVEAGGRMVSACTQPAAEGLKVLSNTEAINAERRTLVQMLFVEGNHTCPGCEKSGACQLQAVAYYLQMLGPRFPHFYPLREVDASHPEIALDLNRCILCELCVRASRDVDGKDLFAIAGRGTGAHLVINSPDGTLGSSNFSIEDRAAEICPVGVFLRKDGSYQVPIGERLYDRQPIDVVGDVHPVEGEDDNG